MLQQPRTPIAPAKATAPTSPIKREKPDGSPSAAPPPKRLSLGNADNNWGADLAVAETVRKELNKITDPSATEAAYEAYKTSNPAEINYLFAGGKTCKNCFVGGKGMNQAHAVKACKAMGNACNLTCNTCKNGSKHYTDDCPKSTPKAASPKSGKGKGKR